MKRAVFMLVSALILDLAAVAAYLVWSEARVVGTTRPGPFDAGVLFFSGFDRNGKLDREGRTRVDHAATLYHDGTVPLLLCIGGHRNDPVRFGAQLLADRLLSLGVPDHALRVDHVSFDTLTNWREATRMLQAEDRQTPLLISGPLHLARIHYIAHEPFPIALSPARTVWRQLLEQPLQTWATVHIEWAAWAAMLLLPGDTHRHWVERWRNFWD